MSATVPHSQAGPARASPIRSFWFALGLVASTIIFAPLTMLAVPLPFRWRHRFVGLWTRFNLWWLKTTCALSHQLEGTENIPEHPVIVMCKHQSAWETLFLQLLFQPQVWVLKRELLWIPFFGWGLAMMRPIAIDRKSGRRAVGQIVEQGKQRLREGCWVIIFPEGTRVAPGQRKRYRLGGAVLAQESGIPVLPIAHNAGEFWPRRSFLKRPGTIRMVVGPLVASKGRNAEAINQDVEAWIESTVQTISGGPFTAPPP